MDSDLDREEENEIFEYDPLEDYGEPFLERDDPEDSNQEECYLDSSVEDDEDFVLLAPIPLRRQMGRVWKTFNVDFALL
jgi:hypothetical protein